MGGHEETWDGLTLAISGRRRKAPQAPPAAVPLRALFGADPRDDSGSL